MKNFFKIIYKWTILLLISLFLIGCGSKEPESIKSAEHDCTHCKMKIINLNHDAQLLTPKGRRYFFDSTECLVAYLLQNKVEVEKKWVKDIVTKKHVEFQVAHFLQSEKLSSPMGANLSAFADKSKAEEFLTKYTGTIFTPDQTIDFVKNNWLKNLSDKEKK